MEIKIVILLAILHVLKCQQDFTQAQIPTFSVGIFFPTRSLNAEQTEQAVCRAIVDHIDRDTPRFRSELVSNTNSRITFQTADSRLMSSRMQSRLDMLEGLFRSATKNSRRMTIQKAWTPFPDSQLTSDTSLHYEGRSVRVTLSSGSNYNDFLRLAVEAGFDWVYYETSNRVRLSVIPSNCARNVDMVFILDRSGSVGSSNHRLALQFMSTAVSFFSIGLDNTRVGVVTYSSSSSVAFDLDARSTLRSLQDAIEGIAYTGGATNTPAALNTAAKLLDPANRQGARPNSKGIPKIAILITDGRSNRGNINSAVSAIRATSIQVYAIGIGNINRAELQLIASNPDNEHVFILSNYLDAAGFVDFLSVTTCDTPAVVDPGDNTTTETTDGGIEYFQTECDAFSQQVLVELTDISGTSHLYASATENNPGPLTMNTVSNTTTGISRRTATVPLPSNSKAVYMGVQGQTNSDTFTIVVSDLLFDTPEVFVDVIEGAAAGTIVYEAGPHFTPNAGTSYTYSIIEVNQRGIFTVNNNGRVSLGNQGVNLNVQRTHSITVQAQNSVNDCQRARIRINIRVIRNRITFNTIPTILLSETASVGTRIVQVVATGGAGNIQYSIVGGNTQRIRINPNTGRLILNQLLDYETTQSYTIRVRAVSAGTSSVPSVSGETDININVQDVNEQPFFTTICATQTSGCSYSIAENAAASTLSIITANDTDLSTVPNGMLIYQLSSNSLPFSIDSSGRLRTTKPLDREDRSSYTLTLRVSDRCSGCALSATTTVRVTVTDVNDNPPIFTSNPNTVEVSEDLPLNTAVAEYRATDADIGSNAAITFTLTPNTIPFSISSTGTLSLTGSIDYETTQSYSIVIIASNPGTSLVTRTTTTIQILNVNDNTPVITGEPYVATVPENSASDALVTTVNATDADLGIHGDIRYFIISGNIDNTFALNSITGALTVIQNIDREMISSFSLVVRAQDRGTPRTRRDMTTITITVSDVNDNVPIFRPNSYSVQLREDLPVGQNVVRVIATDADQPDTPNSNIAYSIIGGNTGNSFRILNNGQIQINQMLDFETTSSYRLAVEGRDGGSPVRSATAAVIVTVINVNENPPTLTGDQSVNISESAPISSIVAVFQAQDQDQMAITINIISGNSAGKFSIDSTTGVITLVSGLDYESTTSYSLTIRASDGEQNTDSSLMVNVLDENEFNPVLSGQTNFMIAEESPAGTTVGTVIATDEDRNDEIAYQFVGQNVASENFILNTRTGVITTSRILDREALTQVFNPPLSRVILQVAATDNGSPSRQTFNDYTITLADINDNTPTFSDTKYTNQLRENLPSGQVVFTTSATDIDLGTNAQITYSFRLTNNQGSSNPFQISSATGTITTTMPLDCELQPFYLFSITATDAGSPPMSSTVIGNLTLIDENDNTPRFSQEIYDITVREDFIPGILTTFTATDDDKGLNGELEYTIVQRNTLVFREGEDNEVEFDIDGDTGALRTFNMFNYEAASEINVTIFVNDKGLPRRSASATLVITVTNVDEEPPVFQTSSCTARVNEDVSIGTIVSTCSAIDFDSIASGSEQPITYSLTNSQLEVNPTNGTITTKSALDREASGAVEVRLTATDSSGQLSLRRFNIILNDVNDNSPQFLNTPYRYHFTDESIRQYKQDFLTIQTIDPDLGENGTVTLKIGSIFQLSDTETQVEVVAQDGGTPPMNSTINVTVTFQSACQLQTFTITPTEGRISAHLLCSIEITPAASFALTLGRSKSLSCRIVRNIPVPYQWLHNGTALTNLELVQQSSNEESLSLTEITYSHSGEYACRASSLAGGLQTSASMATIIVIPTITTAPVDITVRLGATATFTCSATGTPPPTIQWFVGTRSVGEGNTLTISDVKDSDSTTYTCIASNIAGPSESTSARLIIFDEFNVVQLELSDIDNPSSDGSCQYFDPTQLSNIIQSVTTQRVVVTGVSGSNLCELSPCSPSPCQNGGICNRKEGVKGNYECTFCRQGYTGVNCTEDINECDQGACGDNGQCSNTDGSFNCNCTQNFTGRRCQYEDRCSSNSTCSGPNEVCVEVLTKQQGYQCLVPNLQTSLTVKFSGVTRGQLDDLIQAFLDRNLQAVSNSQQTTRRKRQISSTLITSCEPRFISTNDTGAALLWVCPTNVTEPTAEEQQELCQYLFEQGVALECKPPNGDVMTLPTTPPLTTTNVKIDLVFLDDTNKPVDALDSIKILENEVIQEELAKNGATVTSVAAQESEPRPINTESSVDIGAIVGGLVGTIIGLALLALVVILIAIVVKKKLDEEESRQHVKKQKAQQMITLEMGNDEQPNSTTAKSSNQALSNTVTENQLDVSKEQAIDNDYDVLPEWKT